MRQGESAGVGVSCCARAGAAVTMGMRARLCSQWRRPGLKGGLAMEGPFKAVAQFVAEVVVAGLRWGDDGALFAAGVPVGAGHGARGGRDGVASDAGAIFVAVWAGEHFDGGVLDDAAFNGQGGKAGGVHGGGLQAQTASAGAEQQGQDQDGECSHGGVNVLNVLSGRPGRDGRARSGWCLRW